ncbi:MAG: hypothetical protein ABIJ81_02065 [Patescibacteria group bacterium]
MLGTLIIALLLAIVINANSLIWQLPYIGLALGALYLILLTVVTSKLIRFTKSRAEQLIWGLVIIMATVAISGSVLFYLIDFGQLIFQLVLYALPLLLYLCLRFNKNDAAIIELKNTNPWPALFYFAIFLTLLISLCLNQINIAVRSPWQILPPLPLVLYGLLVVTFIAFYRKQRSVLWLVILGLGTWSLLPLVFPLSYGFDPWVHQASERLLALTGTISPKPLYYLGQYSLVVFLSKLLSVTVENIDRWLLLILASLTWASSFFLFLKNLLKDHKHLLVLAASSLIFVWSIFTITNPQALANMWALAAIMLMATRRLNASVPWWPIILVTAACLFTHPLTGLPLVLIMFLFWLFEQVKPAITWLKSPTAIVSLLIVPLSFVVFSELTTSGASVILTNNFLVNLAGLGELIKNALPILPYYVDLVDFVYLIGRLLVWGFLFLAGWGLFITKNKYPGLKPFALAFALLTGSFLIMKLFFTFPYLTANEQGFYSERLWQLALLFLWPLVMYAIADLWQKGWLKGNSFRLLLLSGLVIGLTTAFYLTYPRIDLYNKATGYNTTKSDIEAVNLIAQDAGDTPYVVLANQAVSAAALHEFGFSKYYNGNFYYPLPTGTNPLYPIFLEAVENNGPYYDVMIKVPEQLGINTIYLVINNYWADSERLNTIANEESSKHFYTSDGKISIFRYDY